jgi:hypothetical protein
MWRKGNPRIPLPLLYVGCGFWIATRFLNLPGSVCTLNLAFPGVELRTINQIILVHLIARCSLLFDDNHMCTLPEPGFLVRNRTAWR